MAINKVVYGNETLIDLTDSTVAEDTLAEGIVAYAANGERIEGTMAGYPDALKEGNWLYRIYQDSTFEAWFKQTSYTMTIDNASGTLYRSPLTSLALPSDLYNNYTVDIRHADVNCAHNNYPAWGMIASYYRAGINFYALSGGSRGKSPNYTLDAYVFGVLS